MAGVFACPECGRELGVEGLSPGREVQCEECLTWVEVPFLPRASTFKRPRRPTRRSAWNSKLLRGAILFAVVTVMALVAIRMIRGQLRSGNEHVLAELMASADEAESSHRYGDAYSVIEAAVEHARTMNLDGSERLDELKKHRDRLSVLEAEMRLAAVDSLNPDQAVGESLTIADRAKKDQALAPLAEAIEAKVNGSRLRQAEADLAIARRAFDSGRDDKAFAAAERLHDRAGKLPESQAKQFQGHAQKILEATVGRTGVALPPVNGRFVVGSAEAYTATVQPHRVEVLKSRGYLPQARRSPWSYLWDEKAPFRLTLQVVESQEGYYLQSKNRMTQVDGTFELLHQGRVAWKTRVFAQTRSPLPDLPAYLAGHLATANKRDPEAERRLHDDAVTQFVEQSARNLRGLPGREAAMRMP